MTSTRAGRAAALGALLPLAAVVALTYRAQANLLFADVLALLVVTAAGCALLGSWLVLRRMAMMADAISHAILFGIAGVLVVWSALGGRPDLGSPIFVVGAALSGVLTVALVEALLGTRLVREDAAIGLVFALLFAVALLAIGLRFRDAHVDEHVVLAGGVEVTVLDQLILRDRAVAPWLAPAVRALAPAAAVVTRPDGGLTITRWRLGPRALWTMLAVLAATLAFVVALRKELALSTFDPALAAALGFAPVALNYALMALVSTGAVAAFQAVGSIIVIALFLAPPAAAFLVTEDLVAMQLWAVVFGVLSAWLGTVAGLAFDVNFGGAAATASGLVFGMALVAAPRRGLVAGWWRRRRQAAAFRVDVLLVHLAHHEGTPEAARETARAALATHLHWDEARVAAVVARALREGLAAARPDGRLVPTEAGRARARAALALGGRAM